MAERRPRLGGRAVTSLAADGFAMDELTTRRLTLRKLRLSDADDIYRYSRDAEVARYVLWDAHQSVYDSRSYVRAMLRRYRSGGPASWGIELNATGAVIGTIGYMWYQPENNAAELGYSLSREHWNLGIMTEALRAVVAYSFEELGINRLEAQHEVANPASGAVMRKAGMQREGLLRERIANKGRYVHVELYSILRSEYASRSR